MDEILQKLLSSDLLSEEAKASISTEWTNSVEQYKQLVREEVTTSVRAEIAEKWTSERDSLIENVDAFVSKKLLEEISELKGDIERFRDLEAEFAAKLVEEKHSIAETLSNELDELVDKMDAFFELRLSEEFEELREDLEVVKQNEFGRKIFEAYATEFNKAHVDEDSVTTKLAAATAKLEDAQSQIKALEESKSTLVREAKLDKILAPLTGKKREQMSFVLERVTTERLEEAYNHFIDRVVKEDTSATPPSGADVKPAVITEQAQLKTGNGDQPAPVVSENKMPASKVSELRKLAGITV